MLARKKIRQTVEVRNSRVARAGVRQILLGLIIALVPAAAVAQNYPSRPITLIVPFPAGRARRHRSPSRHAACQRKYRTTGARREPRRRGRASCRGGREDGGTRDGHTLFLANIGTHAIEDDALRKVDV